MKQHRIARAGQHAATLGLILGMGLLAACRSHAPATDGPVVSTFPPPRAAGGAP